MWAFFLKGDILNMKNKCWPIDQQMTESRLFNRQRKLCPALAGNQLYHTGCMYYICSVLYTCVLSCNLYRSANMYRCSTIRIHSSCKNTVTTYWGRNVVRYCSANLAHYMSNHSTVLRSLLPLLLHGINSCIIVTNIWLLRSFSVMSHCS